jgi:hypothetical protein
MNSEYYESVLLATIDKLQKEGKSCGQLTLVKEAKLGNVTIIAATKRLEEKGRLKVIRKLGRHPHQYEILDPPTKFDLMVLSIHLEIRDRNGADDG